MDEIALGDSIACDGACLTVISKVKNVLAFDVSHETLARTTLRDWKAGKSVNLEQALRAGTPLGGHFVSGHVDDTTTLESRSISGDSIVLRFKLPAHLSRFVAEKGSVTLNGVSLTVNTVEGNHFLVNIVPHTQHQTNLGALQPGDRVNLEIDLIARYLDRLHHANDQY